MNDPSKLFRILTPYQDANSPDTDPTKYTGEYFQELFHINAFDYIELVKTAQLIATHSKNKKPDLTTFIQGAVLSKPYGLNNYASCIASIAETNYVNISGAINAWLEDKFRTNHPTLFQKLDQLDYSNKNTQFNIINSKSPNQLQQIAQKTNACTCNSPLLFFEQIAQDAGTVYLIAIQREQEKVFKDMKQGQPDVGFLMLNAYQGEDKNETMLSVDHVWINNKNKKILCALVDSLVDLSQHLDLPIIDKTMSRNYLLQMENRPVLDIYDQQQSIFKLGHVPQILRYNKLMTPVKNDGFYIINSVKNCKEKK